MEHQQVPTSLRAYMAWKGAAPAAAAAPKKSKADKKAEKKAQKAAKKESNRQVVAREPVPIKCFTDADFGDLPVVQSAFKTNRVWADFKSLNSAAEGQSVWLRGRVHGSRLKGNMTWILMRRGVYTVQAIGFADKSNADSKALVKFAGKIPNESVVDIFGTVAKVEKPITSATQSDVEIQIKKIYVVNAAAPELPFQLEDASRQESKDAITVGQHLRLNNRWLDMRTQANHAIFRIQSGVCQYFRSFFLENSFTEIHTPKIIPGASEGGADIFKLNYFNRTACLAQSPQLYKQMAVISDLFKVFEIGPVFRAENSNTHRHLCEFTGLDFEMEIKEHYHEVLRTLGNLFVHIFDNLNKYHQPELEAINKQYPFKPLRYGKANGTLVFEFAEAVKLLNEAGEEMGAYDDFSTPQEKKLGKIIAEKHNLDFYIVDKYPLAVRPFYTMPCPKNNKYSNSYDAFLRGEEITSGAQRVHDVGLLTERATQCDIPLESLSKYIESFSMGSLPHGGAGIGMERVVMLFLGLDNVRKTSMFPRTPDRCEP